MLKARLDAHRAKKAAFQQAPEHTTFNFLLNRARIKLKAGKDCLPPTERWFGDGVV